MGVVVCDGAVRELGKGRLGGVVVGGREHRVKGSVFMSAVEREMFR